MATVHATLDDLMDSLQLKFATDFDRLKIRNYGFQAPGLLDPNKARSGRVVKGIRNINRIHEAVTVPVMIGKIAPCPTRDVTSEEDIYNFMFNVGEAIAEWSECEAINLTKWCVVNAEIAREQDRKIPGGDKDSWWWVIRWQFELTGFFSGL